MTTHTKYTPSSDPIWSLFTLDELHDKTRYAESYLLCLKEGRKPTSPRCRVCVATVLGQPEGELFNEGEEADC